MTWQRATRWLSQVEWTALAILSAIVIVVGFSATETTTGIIVASTTRSPSGL